MISDPGILKPEFDRLLSVTNVGETISVIMHFDYADAAGTRYETGMCLKRLNAGAIGYCRDGNYIK